MADARTTHRSHAPAATTEVKGHHVGQLVLLTPAGVVVEMEFRGVEAAVYQ